MVQMSPKHVHGGFVHHIAQDGMRASDQGETKKARAASHYVKPAFAFSGVAKDS